MATLRSTQFQAGGISQQLERLQPQVSLSSQEYQLKSSSLVKAGSAIKLARLVGTNDVSQGLPRDKTYVPISPVSDPTDVVLFEDPKDPGKKMYLPRYRMRSQGGRYEIGIRYGEDSKWRLIIGLERFPAPELGDAVNGLQMIPHEIEASLHYNTGPTYSIMEEIIFTENVEDGKGGRTISVGLDLVERDALLFTLQTRDAKPRLVIRRTINVAVKIEAQINASDFLKRDLDLITFRDLRNITPPEPDELRFYKRATR